jgi:NAD(P)-dependent dehydrogenase (short-subunit alcohol dehydrogenase family)
MSATPSVRGLGRLVTGTAVVTGGGSGIGRAIAEALAAGGAPVTLVDVLPDGGREAVEGIRAAGGRAAFLEGDVSRWDDVDRAVTEAVRTFGPLGIMVNAAGVLDGYVPADRMAPGLWERVLAIDLTGTFWGCKRALADLLPARQGRILNIASVAGLVGSGGGPAYTAAKHGVVGLTRQLAITYASQGVTINAICPGAIQTPPPCELRPDPRRGRAHGDGRRRSQRGGHPGDHPRRPARDARRGRGGGGLPGERGRGLRDGPGARRRRGLDRRLTRRSHPAASAE